MADKKKIIQNTVTKCEKCECLILSDSSDDLCIHPGNPNYDRLKYSVNEDDREPNENIALRPKCQSHVKITVETKCVKNDESTTSASSASDSSSYCRRLQTDFSMKNICFRLCPKKCSASDKKGDSNPASGATLTDNMIQTSEEIKNESLEKSDSAEKKSDLAEKSDVDPTANRSMDKASCTDPDSCIEELIKKYGLCCRPPGGLGGGGCNTNAIIFPNNKMSGDNSFTKLEDFIRSERRNTDIKLEEILNELCRQKREIREVKDLLELLSHLVKSQMYMKNGKNGMHNFCIDVCKGSCKPADQPGRGKENRNSVAATS